MPSASSRTRLRPARTRHSGARCSARPPPVPHKGQHQHVFGPASTFVTTSSAQLCAFFFFILKKNQNFKNICPFRKNSKIYPGRPMGGATGFKCNFFFQICNEVPGVKKRGGCRPLGVRQGPLPFYKTTWPSYAAIPFVI